MARKSKKLDLTKVDYKKLHQLIVQRSKVMLVDPAIISPNPHNKNKMGKQYFDALKANLANENIGFTQPILVRPHPEKEGEWMIVDGEHRWRAATDIGYEEVPCINLNAMPEALAKYLMLEQNAVRGQTSDEDQKRILQEIQAAEEWKTLMQDFDIYAGTVTEEMTEDASKYQNDAENEMDGAAANAETTSVTLYFTTDQMAVYRKIIGQLRLGLGLTAESSVMRCIEHFESSTGFGIATGEEILDAKIGTSGGNSKPPPVGRRKNR